MEILSTNTNFNADPWASQSEHSNDDARLRRVAAGVLTPLPEEPGHIPATWSHGDPRADESDSPSPSPARADEPTNQELFPDADSWSDEDRKHFWVGVSALLLVSGAIVYKSRQQIKALLAPCSKIWQA